MNAAALTPDRLAEQAGAHIGLQLLNKLLQSTAQADAVRLIQAAVIDVEHPRAAAGFAVVLSDVLMRGLRTTADGGCA